MTAKKKILVVATAQGFYGHLRDPGEQFEVTVHEDDEAQGQAKWYREVDKSGDVVLTKEEKKDPSLKPVIPSAPFGPAVEIYKAKHNGGGNYIVIDADGTQVGEPFAKVVGDNGAAKMQAQQSADAMNRGGGQATISPPQAALVQTTTALDAYPSLNVTEDDDGHPDA